MSSYEERQAACLKAAGYAKPNKRDILKRVERLLEGEGPMDPMRFEGVDRTAVVMPCRA